MNPKSLLLLLSLAALTSGCAHMFESLASPSYFSESTDKDPALKSFYARRATLIDQRFMSPAFHGNIVTWFSPEKAKLADNTVYLGNVIAWQALASGGPVPSDAFKRIAAIVQHISEDLSQPTTLPDGSVNRGFFFRDNEVATSVMLDGKTYAVASDAQGDGNEQSQDQIVHLLYGYRLAMNAARLHPEIPEAVKTRDLIVNHAHQIGLRLKTYNYIVTNPDGKAVKRGADARGFAWPIAQTIASLTGNPLSMYLEKLKLAGPTKTPVVADPTKLRETFYAALDGLSAGVCDLTVGNDHRDLCSRFTLRMINAIYYASGTYLAKPLYIQRMDADCDYLGAASARLGRGEKLPERYLDELKSAVGTDIQSNTAPALWCRENRWIFMPTTCPEEDNGTVYAYNGVDFLEFYAALRFGSRVFKQTPH